MSRTTKLLGTVSVLATLAAGPAAADQLAGFAGYADVMYSHSSLDWDEYGNYYGAINGVDVDSVSLDDLDGISVGAGIAFPVEEIPNLAWQLDGNYSSQSGGATVCIIDPEDPSGPPVCGDFDRSQIVWNLGGSMFWAGPQSRWGINVNYETTTDLGSLTNGGAFVEWYFGNFTAAAKGGWLWSGGTPAGGRGNYLGGQVGGYFVPNLWVGGSVTWSDLVSGSTLVGGGIFTPPCFGATCGRRDLTETNFTIDAEFLVSQTFPLSVFGGYTFTDWKISENVSNSNLASGADFNTNTFFIGVRYYLGGMGSLMDTHRNGNLRGWLRGAN